MLTTLDFIFGYLLLFIAYLGTATFMLLFSQFVVGSWDRLVKDNIKSLWDGITSILGVIVIATIVITSVICIVIPGILMSIYSRLFFGSDLFTDFNKISVVVQRVTSLFSTWGASPFIASVMSIVSIIASVAGMVSSLISIYEFVQKRLHKN